MTKADRLRHRYNYVLLAFIVIYVFIIGLFEHSTTRVFLYNVVITAIYLLSVLTITHDKRSSIFYYAAGVIGLNWLTEYLHMDELTHLSDMLSFMFFILVVVLLVMRIANSKKVGRLEFLEAINVYFLIAVAGSLLFKLINNNNAEAFNKAYDSPFTTSDLIYYTLVTFTTLGYGDITPADSLAKSLSLLMSVSGQLYLTMIIAVLVGKYLGGNSTNANE